MPSTVASGRSRTTTDSPSFPYASTPWVCANAYGMRATSAGSNEAATVAAALIGVSMTISMPLLRRRTRSGRHTRTGRQRHGDALHRRQRRQLGRCRIGPEPAWLRLDIGLLATQIIVPLRRDGAAVDRVADDRRLDEYQQIGLRSCARVVAKSLS